MKGIAHFLSGIAAASFIPAAVAQSAQGAWLLTLAGACALLPDTLDFKFARFLERPDDTIDPGVQPNAQALAVLDDMLQFAGGSDLCDADLLDECASTWIGHVNTLCAQIQSELEGTQT